jgi:hypothetical protein
MQFALKMLVLNCPFVNHSQGILGVNCILTGNWDAQSCTLGQLIGLVLDAWSWICACAHYHVTTMWK